MRNRLLILLCLGLWVGCQSETQAPSANTESYPLRVATFNVEDVRTDDLKRPDHPRLQRVAAIIAQLRPDIILINEIAHDQPGGPGYVEGEPTGQNGQRLADAFIHALGPDAPRYQAYTPPVNTGLNSGLDLDNSGTAVTTFPTPPPAAPDGTPGRQTPDGRAYGNDSWGFGTFPGQYGMALLVREDLTLMTDQIRTFQNLPWHTMPDALAPVDPTSGTPWFDEAEWAQVRLSSKTHADVPVQLPNGRVLHLLCSHPTPPAFDGPEARNKRRNHDEIRFWADYLNSAAYITDDTGQPGGLPEPAHFVILGDQNADPDEGSSIDNPIGRLLLEHPRINGDFVPTTNVSHPSLDDDDTAGWGLRVDYVLPSTTLQVEQGGILRPTPADSAAGIVSDHFPVWLDIQVPAN